MNDRTPRPCLCPRARHRHGTREAYGADGCRCRPCTDAHASYRRRQKKLKTMGRTARGYTDAEPVRRHIAELHAAGLAYDLIARRAEVNKAYLQVILQGRNGRNGKPGRTAPRRVEQRTADRIMAVTAAPEPRWIDGIGIRRRLHALVAIGWRQAQLAELLGVHRAHVSRLSRGYGKGGVSRQTWQQVADLYERLCMAPQIGPAADKARALADRNGWPPPLAWDDESIDNPAARPNRGHREPAAFDEVAVQRAMHGDAVHLRPVERAETVRRLTEAGLSAAQIAARLDTTTRSVVRLRGTA